MYVVTGLIDSVDGDIEWVLRENPMQAPGLLIQFPLLGYMEVADASEFLSMALDVDGVSWLRREGLHWILNFATAKTDPYLAALLGKAEWCRGLAGVTPYVFSNVEVWLNQYWSIHPPAVLSFTITKEDHMAALRRERLLQRIFLSFSGADRQMVRRFYDTLQALGFVPWFDEEALSAGTEMHRGIRQGFKESCAAVFFITPSFKDDRFLRVEVNYAIEEKTAKGGRFAIITLVFADEKGGKGTVPDLLKSYIWKEPATELDALREIVRALPIEPGLPEWKGE